MKFQSTNGRYSVTSFAEAILHGFCPDGGLLMPENLPKLDNNILTSWRHLNYPSLLTKFLQYIIDKTDPIYDDLKDIELETFHRFHRNIAPMKKFSRFSVFELFHGPTLAFKDYAMFPLAFLIDKSIKIKTKSSNNVLRKQNLLIATTGDTGGSALEATRHYPETINTFVMFPKERVTKIQKLQMITANSTNGYAIECSGTCDDIEEYIRMIYKDEEFCKLYDISCLNSVNCGRILCQIALYIYGYLKVARSVTDTVNMAIPCGGWGNVISACMAYSMGLPIKIVMCNNENDLGHKMMKYGVIEKQKEAHFSWSSSMDTMLPYNMPRLLWLFSDRDTTFTRNTMEKVDNNEKVFIPKYVMEKMRHAIIDSNSVNCHDTIEAMKRCHEEENYYICPHTATAASYYYKNEKKNDNIDVVVSTASVNKFSEALVECKILTKEKGDTLLLELKRKIRSYTFIDSKDDPVTFLKSLITQYN